VRGQQSKSPQVRGYGVKVSKRSYVSNHWTFSPALFQWQKETKAPHQIMLPPSSRTRPLLFFPSFLVDFIVKKVPEDSYVRMGQEQGNLSPAFLLPFYPCSLHGLPLKSPKIGEGVGWFFLRSLFFFPRPHHSSFALNKALTVSTEEHYVQRILFCWRTPRVS